VKELSLSRAALRVGVALLVVSPVLAVRTSASSEEYSIFVSVDETKVSIESANFTVVVTKEWPRVIFWHTTDILSPTFEVGFPRMYLFNDSDGNGVFSRSETNLTVFMDANRAPWTFSSVEVGHRDDMGEYLHFSMYSTVSAYAPSGEGPPEIEDFANVTFYFMLAENTMVRENSLGSYSVEGKTDLWTGMSIQIRNLTDLSCLATEAFLQGGASTMLFNISGAGGSSDDDALVLSARVDERLNGEDFTHPLDATEDPQLMIKYAKDDGTARAFYARSSDASYELNDSSSNLTSRSSCYTTGTGLVLHSVLALDDGTVSIFQDGCLGLHEESFTGRIRDLVRENLPFFLGAVAGVTIVIAALSYLIVRRRRPKEETPQDIESDGTMP
jgi:hypothetical protein